ncbi:major royal jelly family protein [Microbulbifer sediminum]|uniref:major royal jelly family protein n=1 Tax=Microbulbifer sediminum TaxID=2904250 RepID=UPI001F4228F9|nr:major royal jelly family protein [Microbulbifer sediminum]
MTLLQKLLVGGTSTLLFIANGHCADTGPAAAEKVSAIRGVQTTGVTVTDAGRIFTNAPNWRDGIPFAVAEVNPDTGKYRPYPNAAMNRCMADSTARDDCFLAVQSVVAYGDKLYALDTRNPKFQGVVDAPRIFVFDLDSNKLERVLLLGDAGYHPDSYINDLRIDEAAGRIYMTDSNHPGLVVYELGQEENGEKGKSYRVLDDHKSTRAEQDYLTIDGKRWNNTVHSDGIALDLENQRLYFHALTGYTLYAIGTRHLDPDSDAAGHVREVAKTSAPDGMILDQQGNLYFADLENHKILYRDPAGETHVLVEGDRVRWADTFSIHDGMLYYTNSRIHEATGAIDDMEFGIYRVRLPES